MNSPRSLLLSRDKPLQIQKTKLQIQDKSQIPISNDQNNLFKTSNFGHWNLFVIWPAFAEAATRRQVLGFWCLSHHSFHDPNGGIDGFPSLHHVKGNFLDNFRIDICPPDPGNIAERQRTVRRMNQGRPQFLTKNPSPPREIYFDR